MKTSLISLLLMFFSALALSQVSMENVTVGGQFYFSSIAELRANTSSIANVDVTSYYAGGTTGGGQFILKSSDTTTADNSCTIFVDASGHRFYRQLMGGVLDVAMCGVKGDGITDDTSALQSAITVACASTKYKVAIPAFFNIGINATGITWPPCTGLDFGGEASVAVDVYGVAQITYIGSTAIAGPLLSINQVAGSRFHDFRVVNFNPANHTATADVAIGVTQTGTITQTNTSNEFDHIYITGNYYTANSNFVGIRIGYGDITGNVDLSTYSWITISCGPSLPTLSSNGSAIQFSSGSAQPFVTQFYHLTTGGCSKGLDIENANSDQISVDGGSATSNFADVYVPTGVGPSGFFYRGVRSENSTNGIYAPSGGFQSGEISGNTFSDTTTSSINVGAPYRGLVIRNNILSGTIPIVPNTRGGSVESVEGNTFPTGSCPDPAAWTGGASVVLKNNFPIAGTQCVNWDYNTMNFGGNVAVGNGTTTIYRCTGGTLDGQLVWQASTCTGAGGTTTDSALRIK